MQRSKGSKFTFNIYAVQVRNAVQFFSFFLFFLSNATVRTVQQNIMNYDLASDPIFFSEF